MLLSSSFDSGPPSGAMSAMHAQHNERAQLDSQHKRFSAAITGSSERKSRKQLTFQMSGEPSPHVTPRHASMIHSDNLPVNPHDEHPVQTAPGEQTPSKLDTTWMNSPQHLQRQPQQEQSLHHEHLATESPQHAMRFCTFSLV